jgi:hypothetical protein
MTTFIDALVACPGIGAGARATARKEAGMPVAEPEVDKRTMASLLKRRRLRPLAVMTLVAIVAALAGAIVAAPAASASASRPAASLAVRTWQNFHSNKCLGVNGGSMANGAKVVQYTCNGAADQEWYTIPLGDGGHYQVRNGANSSKCLAVPGGSFAQNTQLVIWDCGVGSLDQYWTGALTAQYDCFALFNYNSGLVVGVSGAALTNTAPVVQFAWLTHPDQIWC